LNNFGDIWEKVYNGSASSRPQNEGFSGNNFPKRQVVSARIPKGTSLSETESFDLSSVKIGRVICSVKVIEKKSKEK
jgi:hypothetical protein